VNTKSSAPASVARNAQTSQTSQTAHTVARNETPLSSAIQRPRITLPQKVILGIMGAWGLVAALLMLRLIGELLYLERFKRDALPLPFEHREALSRWATAAGYAGDTRVCVSPHTDVPVAIGLFDSMILLPQQLLDQLSPMEIEHIALHELAHLRRHDDWFNALERVLVTLYFFNPVVRWIAAQMDVEREVACDDHVVDFTHEVRPYAHCLTRMAEVTQWPRAALAAPGVFVTRKSMSIRIERLLRAGTSHRVRISYATAIAAAATVAIVFAGAQIYGPVIAAPLAPKGARSIAKAPTPAPVKRKPSVRDAIPAHAAADAPTAAPTVAPKATLAVLPSAVALRTTRPAPTSAPVRRQKAVHTQIAAPHAPRRLPCEGCNLSGVDWRGANLRGIVLHGANLSGADLRNADLRDADLSGSNLQDVKLAGARLDGARLSGVAISGSLLRGVDLSHAYFSGASVDTAGVDESTLRALLESCSGCNFSNLDARGKNLSGLHISGDNFASADLRNANLRNTTFDGVNLSAVRLQGAQLDGAAFNGCNFSNVDLRGVDLSHATLTGSNISNTIMQ
jgi:uncharacterized protein YjbI with pentapeptide repeats/beta-lactamase regulating signal transducer with metallopeptidase domain